MIKLLVIIYKNESILKLLFKKYNLTYNVLVNGEGTASNSLLAYFGLEKIKKNIFFSLIPSNITNDVFKDLKSKLKLKNIGKGIAFTIPLKSSSKFIKDNLAKGEDMEKVESKYELVITIVNSGYSELVMQSAYKEGCSGGTVIKGRSIENFKTLFMDLSIEPEKDLVLNVVSKDIKKNVMEKITKECGIKTDARGIVLSVPIDNVLGLH